MLRSGTGHQPTGGFDKCLDGGREARGLMDGTEGRSEPKTCRRGRRRRASPHARQKHTAVLGSRSAGEKGEGTPVPQPHPFPHLEGKQAARTPRK